MKNIKKHVKEVVEIQRSSGVVENLDSNTALFLLLGYCDASSEMSMIDLDTILNSTDVKSAVKGALESIGENREELKEAISNLNNLNLSNDGISKIIVTLKSAFLKAEDYRVAFEYMIEITTELSRKVRGEGITPNFINKLAVEIVEPKDGEFYDGTFGLGGDAIEAYKFSSKYGNGLKIYGQELDIKTCSIAKIRMFINEIKFADIEPGDVLTNPAFMDEENTLKKFDSIIMHPPFGLNWKEKQVQIINDKSGRFIYGIPGVSSADWLFTLTALKSLNDTGKAVVITTIGALFRAGSEKTLRKKIIGFDYIEAVITLPGRLFDSTGMPCALIVFNMNKSEGFKNKIQFINADEIYEAVRRGKNILNEENINFILDIYRNKKIVEGISAIVELKDIDDGNISPNRYAVRTEFETDEFGKVKIHLEKLNSSKRLGDIGELYRGINVTSKDIQDPNGEYKIINLADIRDGELDVDSLLTYSIENNARVESYKVEAGDIIISNRGATKICVIPEHEGNVLISQNFIGIRLKNGNNSEYIKEFLESPIGQYLIENRKTGTMVTTINPKDLRELPIVYMSSEDQNNIINDYIGQEKKLKLEMKALQVKMDNVKLKLYEKMNIKDSFEVI